MSDADRIRELEEQNKKLLNIILQLEKRLAYGAGGDEDDDDDRSDGVWAAEECQNKIEQLEGMLQVECAVNSEHRAVNEKLKRQMARITEERDAALSQVALMQQGQNRQGQQTRSNNQLFAPGAFAPGSANISIFAADSASAFAAASAVQTFPAGTSHQNALSASAPPQMDLPIRSHRSEPKKPRYCQRCPREKYGIHCHRKSCDYVHSDQTKLYRQDIPKLPRHAGYDDLEAKISRRRK
ncbi:hypothetical protein CC80DRAFT_247978 [Byssothecium circinans]|uniref:Uncharacterized protein n=1 Tax=Byssothecium circinans TaxID=147558 RepID=A0A6A5TCW9_9PLEO|nr:hypothetical protein CC80DRAFT_247978 [Byssothecium circinans]